jgi:hypothetical protein
VVVSASTGVNITLPTTSHETRGPRSLAVPRLPDQKMRGKPRTQRSMMVASQPMVPVLPRLTPSTITPGACSALYPSLERSHCARALLRCVHRVGLPRCPPPTQATWTNPLPPVLPRPPRRYVLCGHRGSPTSWRLHSNPRLSRTVIAAYRPCRLIQARQETRGRREKNAGRCSDIWAQSFLWSLQSAWPKPTAPTPARPRASARHSCPRQAQARCHHSNHRTWCQSLYLHRLRNLQPLWVRSPCHRWTPSGDLTVGLARSRHRKSLAKPCDIASVSSGSLPTPPPTDTYPAP